MNILSYSIKLIIYTSLIIVGLDQIQAQQCFDIPYLKNIIIDGKQYDWGQDGFKVESLSYPSLETDNFPDVESLYASFRLAWNQKGLLLLLRVLDDKIEEAPRMEDLGRFDSFEIYVGDNAISENVIHLGVSPGIEDQQPNLRMTSWDLRYGNLLTKNKIAFESARNIIPGGGYLAEVLIPWKILGISPNQNTEITFQIYINDKDGDRFHRKGWLSNINSENNSKQMVHLKLADRPSPPVVVSASYIVENFRRIKLEVTATPEFTNKTIRINLPDGSSLYSDFKQNGQMVSCYLTIPLIFYLESGSIILFCDDKPFYELSLKEYTMKKVSYFKSQQIKFHPFVFTGESFPACNFENPNLVEDLIGPFQISIAYYDSGFHRVSRALNPGRYGAVVTINNNSGKSYRRFYTLFRLAHELDMSTAPLKFDKELLSRALDCDSMLIEENRNDISMLFLRLLQDKITDNAYSAIYFAGLTDKKTGNKNLWRYNARNLNMKWWFECMLANQDTSALYPHKIYLPKDYVPQKNDKLPLIVFLHGANAIGDDFQKVQQEGLAKLMEENKKLPCIVVAPQCPDNENSWVPAKVKYLVDKIIKLYPVDEKRIYITGLSMGGFGTWATLESYPDLFAAAAPICGGGDPNDVTEIKSIPIWCFHGDSDNVVPIRFSQNIVNALKQIGGNVQFTVYPGVGHDCWTQTYQNEELYKWMLQQRKK